MITWNTAAQALIARAKAGETIPQAVLVYFGLTLPQRWAVGALARDWGGYTWAALDISISNVEGGISEFGDLRFTFPAVTDAELALAFDPSVEGAIVRLYLGLVDPDTGVVADAKQRWAGELDQPGWQDGPGGAALLNFSAEHRATVALRQRPSRYTNDEQLRLHPGDTSLDVDPLTDAAPLLWPAASYWKV